MNFYICAHPCSHRFNQDMMLPAFSCPFESTTPPQSSCRSAYCVSWLALRILNLHFFDFSKQPHYLQQGCLNCSMPQNHLKMLFKTGSWTVLRVSESVGLGLVYKNVHLSAHSWCWRCCSQPHFAMYCNCGWFNQSPIDESNLGCFH